MINLLPENEKKEINREYRLRRLASVLFGIFLVTISTAIFLLPSFVLSQYKVKNADSKAEIAAAKSGVNEADLSAQIEIAKQLAATLKPEEYILPSYFIDLLAKNKTSQNSITSVSYSRDANGGIIVSVGGVAKSRQGLVSFTDKLGKEPGIGKIDIPVSNFTKDTNIVFSFTINIPAPKK